MLSPWTPQQFILDHPVGLHVRLVLPQPSADSEIQGAGWFVAHGGHNGVTEAISAAVPQYTASLITRYRH